MKKLFTLLLLLAIAAAPVYAQSKQKLEKEKAQLEQEIKKLNNELAKAKKNTKLTTKQLNALNAKINERTKLIKNINGQLVILDNQINETQDSINVMHNRIDSLKTEYAKIIRVLYREKDNIDKMVLLLDTKSYNTSYLRMKYFAEYSRYRRHQAAAIKQHEELLQETQLQLQKQKNEKNTLLAQEKKHKAELDREQQQKRKSMNDSKQQEKNLTAQISKKEKQKKQLQQQIQKIINEEVAKANKANGGASSTGSTTNPSAPSYDVALSNNFAENKGRLSWPVYYKSVAREYGRYTHSSGGQNMNNGIDLITAPGAVVSSIFNGTVTRVFTCPNGTKGVIVRHGEYMTVYANLNSVSVKEGAIVTTKQSLGTVASGDAGTGEFSFQLWKGTASQNPRSWLRG